MDPVRELPYGPAAQRRANRPDRWQHPTTANTRFSLLLLSGRPQMDFGMAAFAVDPTTQGMPSPLAMIGVVAGLWSRFTLASSSLSPGLLPKGSLTPPMTRWQTSRLAIRALDYIGRSSMRICMFPHSSKECSARKNGWPSTSVHREAEPARPPRLPQRAQMAKKADARASQPLDSSRFGRDSRPTGFGHARVQRNRQQVSFLSWPGCVRMRKQLFRRQPARCQAARTSDGDLPKCSLNARLKVARFLKPAR